MIFAYTDGITEAVNNENEMYGEQRLLDTLNNANVNDIYLIHEKIKQDIKDNK